MGGRERNVGCWEEISKKKSRITARREYWIEESTYSGVDFSFIFLK